AHAPRAVGLARRSEIRKRRGACGSCCVQSGRLCTSRDFDGAQACHDFGPGGGAVVDEPRISKEMNMQRRRFLLGAGALAASAAVPQVLFAHTGGSSRLVVVILRGALDGLAAVPPYGDPDYAALHRELAIAAPGSTDGALALNNTFGLHPALSFLHERFAAGELIVFNAVASPYRDRSHFDGQNVLENGLAKPIGSADGWLNRALAALPIGSGRAADRAVAISQNVPLILRGEAAVISKSPQFTADVDDDLLTRLADLYSRDDWFAARLSEAMQTEKMVDGATDSSADLS